MKAFAYYQAGVPATLIHHETPRPNGRDLLVSIEALAVNPVDTKQIATIQGQLDTPRIVGYDACGTVLATGPDCQLFQPGDNVFYAGDVSRDGCYASHQLVDERITGLAPSSLSAPDAAAMPLTSLTAWESLFDRMKIRPDSDRGKTILLVGAAGGVGSIAIQLAKKVAGLRVIATASRPESIAWCQELGADAVINHHHLQHDYAALGITAPDYILCLNNTDSYFPILAELIAPQGLICFLVTSQQTHNIDVLKNKSAGIVWEFMFTRPYFKTADIEAQHRILNQIARLLDDGVLRSTNKQHLGALSAETLAQAHQLLLSGTTLGKITLSSPD